MLIGCGLRRGELLALRVDSIQSRRALGHRRPAGQGWAYQNGSDTGENWRREMDGGQRNHDGAFFRSIDKRGRVWGTGMTPKVLWEIVKAAAARADIPKLAPHDLRRTCARLCHLAGGELDQIQFLLGHFSIETTEQYLGCKQKLRYAVNDKMGIEP
jgi:integrase